MRIIRRRLVRAAVRSSSRAVMRARNVAFSEAASSSRRVRAWFRAFSWSALVDEDVRRLAEEEQLAEAGDDDGW
ncbi:MULTISPECIES: hypothetical protein [Streptomyces]|uniref:hypothetical protein n=1 Tax=Streptomyces TaxID=1883 RepID=UPI0012FECE16|nr:MULTISPECIES: hypothetical protein [Streptomyces]